MENEITVSMEDVIKEHPEILEYQRQIRAIRANGNGVLLRHEIVAIMNKINECLFAYCEARMKSET